MMRDTQLFFARETLHNAYDQKDWRLVHEMCQLIDRLTIAKNKQELDALAEKPKEPDDVINAHSH